MTKKKRLPKNSIKEAQKAQIAVSKVNVISRNSVSNTKVDTTAKNSLVLPIAEIKKDLNRNLYFAVFAVVVLIVLNQTRPGFTLLSSFLNF